MADHKAGVRMVRNPIDPERRARDLDEFARARSHDANRVHLARTAKAMRHKARVLTETATLHLGQPMIHDASSRIWWVMLLRAVLAIVFGVLTLVWPRHSARVLLAFFGAYAVFDGLAVYLIAAKAGRRRHWLMLTAAVHAVAGLAALTQPLLFALLLVRVLGGWLVLRSVTEAVSELCATGADTLSRPGAKPRWGVLLNGAMTSLFGIGLIAAPKVGALSLMWAVGAWAVLHGLLMIPVAWGLRRRDQPPGAG